MPERTVKTGYKFKLRPTDEQREKFRMFAGARRWVWNELLEKRQQHYEETGENLSLSAQDELIREKKETDEQWLEKIHSQIPQQVIRDLQEAYNNFFNDEAEFPRFKSKKEVKQTFRIPQGIKIKRGKVYLPKIGWVRFFKSQPIEGELKSATVKRQAHGWFVSIIVEQKIKVEFPEEIHPDDCIGIDLGLKDFAVLSNGERISKENFFENEFKKLRKEQQKLSRKECGSNNWDKQKTKVERKHAKIRRKRKDFLHKLSSRLVRENQAVIVEDLEVEGMQQSNLSKSISDAAWSEFVRMLEYKCERQGTHFIKTDKYEPTSRTCRHCGTVNDIDLSDRKFKCESCREVLDRDYNAAKNIKNLGLNKLAGGQPDTLNASGEPTSDWSNVAPIKVGSLNEEPSGVAKRDLTRS